MTPKMFCMWSLIFILNVNAASVHMLAELAATDGAESDLFGRNVAIHGDFAIVGSHGDDDMGTSSGSAYIFQRNNNNQWNQVSKLVPSDGLAGDEFGVYVDITDNYAIVGANLANAGKGCAYIFKRDENTQLWNQMTKLTTTGNSKDWFGYSVSIDGHYAIVGAHNNDAKGTNSGAAYIFHLNTITNTWQQTQKLIASDGGSWDIFGVSVSIHGNYCVIGAKHDFPKGSHSGSAYIFELKDNTWTQQQKLTASDGRASDYFGSAVSIHNNYAIIMNDRDSDHTTSAYIFERNTDSNLWVQSVKLSPPGANDDWFGRGVGISDNYAIIGANYNNAFGTEAGAAFMYERSVDGVWQEIFSMNAPNPTANANFGVSVAMDGQYAIVGALNGYNAHNIRTGAAYIFSVDKVITNCEQRGEIKHINWHELQNENNSKEIPYSNVINSLNENTLEITFDIDLGYLGWSNDGHFDDNYNLGTTYVIDFQSFGTNNLINQPGNCQNRLISSFTAADFNNYWTYSESPFLDGHIGTNKYLSYPPPSDFWTLNISDNTCSPIKYFGVFSWADLKECKDYIGNKLISIVDQDDKITLSGTLYVSVVSPYIMSHNDSGIYRTFPLIQQDFFISMNKQINILSSTGIDLFVTSIIGIFEDQTDKSFKLSILAQSADYIILTNPNIISTPFKEASISTVTQACLPASPHVCAQVFTISINESQISCPTADFGGIYQVSFTVTCPAAHVQDVCNTFLNDNGGSSVMLQVESNFVDNTCEAEVYSVTVDGSISFYDDAEFSIAHIDDDEHHYIIGKDTIYAQVEVNFPDDGTGLSYDIFAVEIENVFVCTANDSVDLTQDLNQQNGMGGCLSLLVDIDGEYNIIVNGIENKVYNAEIIQYEHTSNVVRFSFLTFDIGRTKMYIHAQLKLILQNGKKRRLLLSEAAGETDSIRHFVDSTTVIDESEHTNVDAANENIFLKDNLSIVLITISSALLLLFAIMAGICIKLKRNKSRYQHEKIKQQEELNRDEVGGNVMEISVSNKE